MMKRLLITLLAVCAMAVSGTSLKAQDPPPQGGFKNALLTVNKSGKVALTYSRWSEQVKKGKYTLVSFWASWCDECLEEFPVIQSVYQSYKAKGLVVLGVPYGDEIGDATEAIEAHKITYPHLVDVDDDLAGPFHFDGIPYIVLLGPDGEVLAANLRGDEIRLAVEKYLK